MNDDRATMRSGAMAWRILRQQPKPYALSWIGWVAFFMVPIPVGLLLKWVLDNVSGDPTGGPTVWMVLAVLAGMEIARWLELLAMVVQWHGAWVGWHTIPRLNMMRSLAVDPGPTAGRLPSSPGEAVSRFRDDCQDLSMVLDVWLDMSGITVTSLVALGIMAFIDLRTTLVVCVPLVVVMGGCHWLGPRLREWRQASREATAEVTGFIGDTFGAITAVKAAGAENAVMRRFDSLGRERARTARRDEVGTQLVYTLSGATGNLGTGLALLLVAPAIRRGDFTVGDLALFTTYIAVLAAWPRWVGRLGAYHRQADVSVGRLAALTPRHDPADVVAPVTIQMKHGPGPFAATRVTDGADRRGSERFERLDVEGLVAAGQENLEPIHLGIDRGELVVVTGPVGSGKSTLLRALLGTIVRSQGVIRWNGHVVTDPSTFFVPPRAAYLPQVPRLFSETLDETVLLGLASDGLDDALWQACLEDDLTEMPEGTATMVGPKGVRLSGGQIQRTAAARSFVRRPELLLVDDISSALDAATEAELWRRLLYPAGEVTTVLVVTHRQSVIAQADQVIRLG